MTRVLNILLLLGGLACVAHAQSIDANNRFRLAQSYEQGGDYENAIKLYRQLASEDPSNYVYFDGLRRSFLSLKRYDEAIGLIRNRLGSQPNDVNLLCQLGSALYQSGNEREAAAAWDRAIATAPNNSNIYRLVANTQLENRLLERAAETYRRARTAMNDPQLFTLDLAQLLSVMMDYRGATTEFLQYLTQNPTQLSYVQNRLAQFTGKDEARTVALDVVRDAQRRSTDMNLNRLLGWLLLEGKEFNEAFAVYKQIDELAKAKGTEIYSFAERAYKAGAYTTAAQAYLAAIATPLPNPQQPYAKFGHAMAMKELAVLNDTSARVASPSGTVPETQARYTAAIDFFRKIIAEYPLTEFTAKSHYQIGTLQFERYFDLDAALASFQNVKKALSVNHSLQHDVSIKIGEVLTAKGDTANAAVEFRRVIAAQNATPDQQDEATYRLAELEYFGGNFKKAVENLETISTNLKANYTNDALELLAFLQENTLTAEIPLKDFARADFLTRQKKYSEAITIFLNLIERNPQALFVDDALMRAGKLYTLSRRYTDALATYERLISQFKDVSIMLDKAQFAIAELYQFTLNNTQQAIAAYEKLLAAYPQSLLTDISRRRIRELRGDTL